MQIVLTLLARMNANATQVMMEMESLVTTSTSVLVQTTVQYQHNVQTQKGVSLVLVERDIQGMELLAPTTTNVLQQVLVIKPVQTHLVLTSVVVTQVTHFSLRMIAKI